MLTCTWPAISRTRAKASIGHHTRDFDTPFRPAFVDPIEKPAPFVKDSVAPNPMRNFAFCEGAGILEALMQDASAKAAATRKIVDGELLSFIKHSAIASESNGACKSASRGLDGSGKSGLAAWLS